MKNFYLWLLITFMIYGCTTAVETPSKEVVTTFSSQPRAEIQGVGCQTPSNQCIDGEGIYIYPSGTRYEGEFRDGKKHGHGILKFADGTYYDGKFHNGKRQGYGEGTFLSGGGYTYEGQWENDKPHGRGIQNRNNGERYEGEFQNGKRHGRGEYQWPSGNRHVGEWQNGKKHGRGIHIFADSGMFMREWRENQIIREGRKVVSEDAKMVEAFFRRETGINPYNREKFAEMLEAFLKRKTYDISNSDSVNKEFGKILTQIFPPEGSATSKPTDEETTKLSQIIEEILIREGYYFPER